MSEYTIIINASTQMGVNARDSSHAVVKALELYDVMSLRMKTTPVTTITVIPNGKKPV